MIGFRDEPAKTCWVRAYDTEARKWHAFGIDSIPTFYVNAIRVFDGGLGCFVPCGLGEDFQPILICNPLTQEWRQLPFPRLVGNLPRMAQLRVDRDRGTYKVIVVGHVGVAAEVKQDLAENSALAAEVYDSETKEWSTLVSGKVLGAIYYWCTWWPIPKANGLGPRVYDCSTGELREYELYEFPERPYLDYYDGELRAEWEVTMFANHMSDLYLLEALPHFELRDYEDYGDEGDCTCYNVLKHEEGNWGFGPTGPPQFRTAPNVIFDFHMDETCGPATLLVCKAFFLAIGGKDNDTKRYHMRLYDVENKKWSEDFLLESNDMSHSVSAMDMYESGICELRRDACP